MICSLRILSCLPMPSAKAGEATRRRTATRILCSMSVASARRAGDRVRRAHRRHRRRRALADLVEELRRNLVVLGELVAVPAEPAPELAARLGVQAAAGRHLLELHLAEEVVPEAAARL